MSLDTVLRRIARRRSLHFILKFLGAKTARFPVIDEISIQFPLLDRTGPGFYLNWGGPAAFYHYEEKEKVELLKMIPHDGVFLDVGANIGLFSAYIAKLLPAVRVYAFEPHPLLVSCLEASVRNSGFRNLSVQPIGLGDREGEFDLYLHANNAGGASLFPSSIEARERGASVRIRTRTLDAWMESQALSRVDAIKIDVQGGEFQVIQGARLSIQKYRPGLIAEIESRHLREPRSPEWEELMRWLSGLGYRVKIAGQSKSVPIDRIAEIIPDSASETAYENFVFTASSEGVKA